MTKYLEELESRRRLLEVELEATKEEIERIERLPIKRRGD